MPELPELEVVREVLERHILGQAITEVKVLPPGGAIVVRDLTQAGFEAALTGRSITEIRRRGKFLVFTLPPELYLVINPKLSGRLQLSDPVSKRLRKTFILFTFANGKQMRYLDPKQMGQVYLTRALEPVPD